MSVFRVVLLPAIRGHILATPVLSQLFHGPIVVHFDGFLLYRSVLYRASALADLQCCIDGGVFQHAEDFQMEYLACLAFWLELLCMMPRFETLETRDLFPYENTL